MAKQRAQKRLSSLKKSRKFRDLARLESRRLHLETLEERRVMATGPALAALFPNGGVFLSNNDTLKVAPRELTFRFAEGQIIDANTILNTAPLVTDNGIRIFRAGPNGILDGLVTGSDDIEVTPGFMGLADSPREVIMRFAENLPDDLYRVTIVGAGATPLKDSSGNAAHGGTDVSIDFNLDLGTKVQAVVPQPITRGAGGALTQDLKVIEVYFDHNELGANVTNPVFYRLINTASLSITLPTNVVFDSLTKKATLTFASNIPAGTFKLEVGATDEVNDLTTQAVHIGNSMDKAYQAFLGDNITLPGAQQNRDIDLYRFDLRVATTINVNLTIPGTSTLDGVIRIFDAAGNPVGAPINAGGAGASENVINLALPAGTFFVGISAGGNAAYNPVTGAGVLTGNSTGAYSFQVTFNDLPSLLDTNSSFGTATPLGILGLGGRLIQAAISPQPYNIQWPGAGDDPGHRDVPYESHIVTIPGRSPDEVNGIREITYDFQSVYGFSPTGQPLFNGITEAQKQRAREVLELYARYLGVQFREISSTDQNSFADFTIATGDPLAVAPTISTNLPAAGVRGIEGIPFVVPAAPLNPSLNDSSVATTFTGSIAGATTGLPIVITSDDHNLQTGHIIKIEGVTGNTAANGVWRITRIDANTFSLNGSIGSADYLGGGTWTLLDISPRVAIMNGLVSWGTSEYGGEYFRTAMHEIGSFLGLGTSFELPDLTIMGGQETPTLATNTGEPVFPGDHDIVHGQALHRPESRDIDLYKFQVTEAGLFRAETIAERMNVANPTLLNTVLTLYKEPDALGQPRQVIARNDDYYGNDSYLEMRLTPGTYYIAVTSTGNIEFDPTVADSGFGGRTQGVYDLKMELKPDIGSSLADTTGVRLDGDADGREGGKYEFWFQSNSAPTIYVDKANTTGPFLGTLADPYNNLAVALDAAEAGPAKIVRVVGNGGTDNDVNTLVDNRPYLIGFKDLDLILDEPLADGADFLVPKDVTVMIDAGANFKLRKANLNAGSTPQAILSSEGGAIQVLGTPLAPVQFTSYHDDTIGGDTDGPQAGAQGGDWGGIVFRGDSDIGHRLDREAQTLTLNNSGGLVTLSFNGTQGSAATRFLNLGTTTAADVQRHLSTIPALAGNVSVTGNPGGPFTVTFINALAGINVVQLQVTVTPTTPSIAIDTEGGPGIVRVSEVQQLILNNSGGIARLQFNGVTGTFESLFFDSSATTADRILLHLNTIPALAGNVAVSGGAGGPFLITFINALAGVNVSQLVALGTPNPLVNTIITGNTQNPILEEVQTLTLTGSGSPVTLTFESVPGTPATRFLDLSSTTAEDVLNHLNSIPALAGNVTVDGNPGGPFSITFVNGQSGVDVQLLQVSTAPTTPVVATAAQGAASTAFLNYVNNAVMSYGGGRVFVDSVEDIYTPIHMVGARPAVSYNTITRSADAAMSADPNSFNDDGLREDVGFDHRRLGPDIHDNALVATVNNVIVNNTINGLFVRIRSEAGNPIDRLDVSARFDDTDIVHVVAENLQISGTPGGSVSPGADRDVTTLADGRLRIDPGIIVKMSGSRIETQVGAQFIAEGSAELPIIFTSLKDDKYGGSGTFDTNRDGAATTAIAGQWGGLVFDAASSASLDRVSILYGGGRIPIEGGFDNFNALEIHQADVRIANSLLQFNAAGGSTGDRNGRGTNADATIFIRGAQPVIVNNIIRDNDGPMITINANALTDTVVSDLGRTTGAIDDFNPLNDNLAAGNKGPFVRGNRMINNAINGMEVRGGVLTTESVWDDTDIAHIVRGEIVVPNHHTYSGLRLESKPNESLVVKLLGTNAGFTAGGTPLDIDDRIGGTLHIVGQPGRPVVLTSLHDDTVSAGFTPDGLPMFDHDNGSGGAVGLPTGPEVDNGTLIDNDVATNTVGHFEFRPGPGGTSLQSGVTAQGNSMLFANQDFIFDFINFVDVGQNGSAIDLSTTTITLQPTLISDDLVASEGTFAGANGPITWRVETRLDDGVGIVFNTIRFTSAQPLGELRLINYLDEDVLGVSDDLLYQTGTPGSPDFRLFTLDNAERIGFAQGGVYTPGPQLENATYTGWAADQFADLRTDIAGAGTTYSVPGNIDTVDLPVLNDPSLGTVHGLADVTTAMAWTVNPTATTATITTFLELVATDPGSQGGAGDWRSIRLDKHSNDRNVSIQLEREGTTVGNADNNRTPQTAQLLGALAPNEKSGDDVRRLGFEIDGTIAYDRPNDVDVYSFTADSGTEVWIDIDRTSFGLDALIELIDANGNVIARATNTNPNAPSLPTPPPTTVPADPGLSGSAQTFNKDHFNGRDTFTTNPWDPIMRVTLPGVNLKNIPYFVRVRSTPTSLAGESGNTVNPGLTSGHYQLQVRLRQQDEKPGSTVRYADIRFATNAVEVLGLPQHSPLLGEAAEADNTANNTLGGSQFLGNLLTSDRNSISVGGELSSATDVDWYTFDMNVDLVQVVQAYTDAGRSWATIFDIDYASGMSRADVTLSVFDETGRLILVGRDSDVEDDQPLPGAPQPNHDLTRGSGGKADPYIGSIQLPTGIVGGGTRRYHVAVSSNRTLPEVLNQTFNQNAAASGVRLEPIESVARAVTDHLDFPNFGAITGGQTAEYPENTYVDPALGSRKSTLIDTTNLKSLQANVRPFSLADVTMFVSRTNRLITVDPFTGVQETDVGALPNFHGDIAMRSDGRLYGYQSPNGTDNVVANLVEINPGNAATTAVGPDNIPNTAAGNNASQTDGAQTQTAIAFRPNRIDIGQVGRLYYAIPSFGVDTVGGGASRLYTANEGSGTANDPNNGFTRQGGLNNVIDGQIDASGDTIFGTVDVRAAVNFRAVPQGSAGNGITINFSESTLLAPGALPSVTTAGNVINVALNATSAQAAVSHNFGGPANFTFTAVNPGLAGNDIVLRVTKRDRGIGVGPEILRVGNNILIELNTNAANPTRASQLLAAFNNPAGPMAGFATAVLSGAGSTNIAATAVGGTVLSFIGGTNRSSPAQVAQAVNASAGFLVQATATGNVNGDATHGGQGGFAIPQVVLSGGADDLGVTGGLRTADGPVGVTEGMAFSTLDGFLYGVSNNGVFYRVSTTGSASMALNAVSISIDGNPFFPGIQPPEFVGMAPAPQNVENGAYADLLFALDANGFLYAFSTQGVPQVIFDTTGDGLADSFQLQTQAFGATGLAFTPLDFNLWHPTYRRQDDTGHDIGVSPSLVHGNSFPDYLPNDGIDDGLNSSEGRTNMPINQSFYFGFEQRQANPGFPTDSYETYLGIDGIQDNFGQLGVLSDDTQRYLSANTGLNNTYDMPGGAYGSLTTDKFSLETLKTTDKPTFYFDYFLNTQDRNAPLQGAQMRDSARVYIGPFLRNGVVEWDLLATNNSVLDNPLTGAAGNIPSDPFYDGELPTFLSTSVTAHPDNPRQQVQLIHDNSTAWRQSRVDLSRYAGLSDLQLRFDFTTSGVMATPSLPGSPAGQAPNLAPVPGEEFQYENQFGNFNSNTRGQENNFEGFFIDNIMVGPAERGEMVIDAPVNTNFFSTPVPVQLDATEPAPSETLVGAYQLEIRRGTEYAVSSGGLDPTITLITTLDTNERLIPDKRLQNAPIPLETFSTGTFNTLPWTAKGDAGWSVTGAGAAGDRRAVSGRITDGQSSDLEVSLITGEGNLTFSMDVSSESLYGNFLPGSPPIFPSAPNFVNSIQGDALRLYIDGRLATYLDSNGVPQRAEWSGNTTIGTVTVPVTAGRHTFRWAYEKDDLIFTGGLGHVTEDFGTNGVNATNLTFKALNSRASGAAINFVEADLGPGTPPIINVSNPVAGPLSISITLNSNADIPTFAQQLVQAINSHFLASQFIQAFVSSGNPFANITVGDPASYSPLIIPAVLDQAIIDNVSFPKPQLGVQDVYDDHTLHDMSLPGWPSAPTVPFPTTLPQYFFVNNLLSGFGRIGDQNVHREQGQILIEQNSIFAPSESGIVVDAGVQDTTPGGQTTLTHPGGVRNLPTLNTAQLAPGTVLINNVIANFGDTGITFSGALPGAGGATTSVPFGRIVNNTIFGGETATGTGIEVSERASPTILNNLISSTVNSITVDGTSASTVIGANLFHGNTTNANLGTDSIVVPGTEPMFVDPPNRNFYLVDGSPAVDSSLDSLQDRQSIQGLRSSIGIPESNIVAPSRDVFGQLRIDDPSQDPPPGLGSNIFKDRGAVERADFSRPTIRLIDPLDNDGDNRDRDPDLTEVIIRNEILTRFVVQFLDVGTGIDDLSVDPAKFTLTSDGVLQVLGTDYTIVHNTNSDEIIFRPVSGQWPSNKTYVITVDNSVATGVRDLAGNPIQGNQADGTVTFTIFVGTVRDFGDAPSPYPSLEADNGAAHDVTLGYFLGDGVDEEQDAKIDPPGDSFDDGITNMLLSPENASSFNVTASQAGVLDAWIDLNQDGDWDDAGEYVLSGRAIGAGTTAINFTFGDENSVAGSTWARFRFTSTGINSPVGVALDGEVEDYQVTLTGPPFQNPILAPDVDNDGGVDTIDLLIVINFLTFLQTQLLPGSPPFDLPLPPTSPPYVDPPPVFDPTGGGVPGKGQFVDVAAPFGQLTSGDLLAVINYLTLNFVPGGGGEGEGEGEGFTAAPAAMALATGSQSSRSVSSSPTGSTSNDSDSASLLIPATLFASPNIVLDVRDTGGSTVLSDDSWLTTRRDEALELVAAATAVDESVLGRAFSLDEHNRRKLAVGPLDNDAWEDLLADLSLDVGGLPGDSEDQA